MCILRQNEKQNEKVEQKEKKCDSSLLIVRLAAEHNRKGSGAETDIDTLQKMHTVSRSISEQCRQTISRDEMLFW